MKWRGTKKERGVDVRDMMDTGRCTRGKGLCLTLPCPVSLHQNLTVLSDEQVAKQTSGNNPLLLSDS